MSPDLNPSQPNQPAPILGDLDPPVVTATSRGGLSAPIAVDLDLAGDPNFVPDQVIVLAPSTITKMMIADLLSTASEGGISYWAEVLDYVEPASMPFRFDKEHIYRFVDYPLNGGSVTIRDAEEEGPEGWILDGEAIKRGLQVMATNHPKHWQDVLTDNHDAATADVFVQCCLFGDVIYG